jgi:hypothetical protein
MAIIREKRISGQIFFDEKLYNGLRKYAVETIRDFLINIEVIK